MSLTPEQSRAARGWLDWTQADLAGKARVALSTVRDFEKGRRVPVLHNLESIQRALEEAEIRLVFDAKGAARGVAFDGEVRGGPERPTRQAVELGKPRGSASRARPSKRSRS